MSYMQVIGKRAKEVSKTVQFLGQIEKNEGLRSVARELRLQTPYILQANAIDVAKARDEGMKPSLIDRLLLTSQRINGMAEGLEQVAELDDPIGEIISMKVRPNGLQIGKRRVPLGVIGIIYESRPNVTADAFGLCFKRWLGCILLESSNRKSNKRWTQERASSRRCSSHDRKNRSVNCTGDDETGGVYRCIDSKRWEGINLKCCAEQHGACNRNRNWKLSYICR